MVRVFQRELVPNLSKCLVTFDKVDVIVFIYTVFLPTG